MTATQCGSYRYDSFDEAFQAQEVNRLHRQASVFLDAERQLWPGLNIVSGQKLLDLGCGSGVVSRALARQVYPAQVIGLDASQMLIDKGKKSDELSNITFRQGSAYNLPFLDNSFDVVYARLLFQHLSEPIDALKEIYRVLRPGGRLCVLDVDKDWSSLYPEPDSSPKLDRVVIQKQLSQGGDPWVGRKLSYYLKVGGFCRVKTTVELIDSDQIGLANFFEMLAFGRSSAGEASPSHQAASNATPKNISSLQKQAQEDIETLIKTPCAWAGFGLFVVTGIKENAQEKSPWKANTQGENN